MTREQYVTALRDLLSGDPERVREANRLLYNAAVIAEGGLERVPAFTNSESDLALAEVAMGS